jgi:hypothetical protein
MNLTVASLIPATLIARRVFRANGRDIVYTNNYKNCRTVKAYRTGSTDLDVKMVHEITTLLGNLGYNGISANFTQAQATYRGRGAIIIRIPK